VSIFGAVEGSNNSTSTQSLSALSVIPLVVSMLKFIYTNGVDALLGVHMEVESFRVDVDLTLRGGRGAPPPFARPTVAKAGYPMRFDGFEQVSTTQQRLLQSFDLGLQGIEAKPQNPRVLLVVLSALDSAGGADKHFYFFISSFRTTLVSPSLHHCPSIW
jgi:hypothetical protein